MAKTSSGKMATDRRRGKPKLSEPQLEKLVAFFERHRAGRTNVDIGKIANVTPSTITMVLKGERVPSVKVIRQLAKVLRPTTSKKSPEEFTDEFLKLASYEPSVVAEVGLSDSVTKRLDRLHVAYIVNEPFVDRHWNGFAADLFNYVIDLTKGTPKFASSCEPNQLQDLMEKRGADIVVPVFPTFQRNAYMDFSNPFPYLRVPLSALVRSGTEVEKGSPLRLKHVVNRTKGSEGLANIKILLVNGEVGNDFVETFLKGMNYKLINTFDPKDIYRQLQDDPDLNLFIANMMTCSAVYELAARDFQPLPDDKILQQDRGTGGIDPLKQFPVLAMYPVTFGLPKRDKDWKKMIDGALDSLMSEGASLLVSLYKTYLERGKQGKLFASLCIPEDEAVTSEPLREMFRALFEAQGLPFRPTTAVGADSQDAQQQRE